MYLTEHHAQIDALSQRLVSVKNRLQALPLNASTLVEHERLSYVAEHLQEELERLTEELVRQKPKRPARPATS